MDGGGGGGGGASEYVITINVPVVYMARNVMILDFDADNIHFKGCHLGPFCILYTVFFVLRAR
jgi:hypothetical protein